MNFKFSFKSYLSLLALSLLIASCNQGNKSSLLKFSEYPDLKIGFTTQNFQKAMPLGVDNLIEILEYTSKEGFQFVELRDDFASLTTAESKKLSDFAKSKGIEVIYEIQKNPLDSGFYRVFEKAIKNTMQFPDPGILRVMISKSEFVSDPEKKGWTVKELYKLADIMDSCAVVAENNGLRLIIENSDESFFGDGNSYYGLADFFSNTSHTGFQFDISNPFRNSARIKSEPEKVIEFLSSMGSRWVASHIKTIEKTGGEMQPVLTDNPLPVEDVIKLMAELRVPYVSLELLAVENKEQCFENHRTSIEFLNRKVKLNYQK